MRILVTGGAGFIGSNFIRYALTHHPDWEIINLDKVTYAGNPQNLADLVDRFGESRFWFARGDVGDVELVGHLLAGEYAEVGRAWVFTPPGDGRPAEVLVHLAAESHVDRSILDPTPFFQTNVRGTQVLLDAVRDHGMWKVVHVSTDEVYGPAPEGVSYDEDAPLLPSSPYAASKAASDLLCMAYRKTYGIPVLIARCTNNYGPYQYPEKFIPLVITNALEDQPIPIYGDGLQVRDWLFVEDHCEALCTLIISGCPGEIYNIAGGTEVTNLEVAHHILQLLDKPDHLLRFVADRPAHDRRYALRADKLAALGWRPRRRLEEGLRVTVDWYRSHEEWWRPIKSGEYRRYYEQWYGRERAEALPR